MGIVGTVILVIIVIVIVVFLALVIIRKGNVLTSLKTQTLKVLKGIISYTLPPFKQSLKQLVSIRSLLACILALLFSLVFKLMLSSCFSSELGEREIIDPISSDWYINAFFTKCNENQDSIPSGDEDIVIINILDSVSSRSNIAKIIETISDQHPKVLGIDIFLSENNDSTNEAVLKAILHAKDSTNIVVSAYWDDVMDELRIPFYSSVLDSTDFGLVNQVSYTQLCTKYNNHPTFSAQVAKKYGIVSIPTDKIVNYRYKEFCADWISNVDSISVGDISNKIVLLGNTFTPSDKKDLPFVVGGVNQLSGVEMLGYEISSLLALNKKMDIFKTPLDYLSPVINLAVCICSLMLYLFFVFIINYIEECRNNWWWKIIMIIGKLFFLIICELLIIQCCFRLTMYWLIVPDITLFIIAIIFVEEIHKNLPNITIGRLYLLQKK